MGKLQEIVQKFTTEVLRWIKDRLTGTVTLAIHISQGGVTDWHIQTTQTKHKGE